MTQTGNQRRRWLYVGAACIAIGGAVLAAKKILPTVPLTSSTLANLMDACAQTVADQDRRPVAGHWLWRLESNSEGAAVAVENGSVFILVLTDLRDNTIHSCELRGAIWGKDATIRNPALPWYAARPDVEAWFARRLSEPGNTELVDLAAGPGLPFAASCPDRDQPGFFLSAGPHDYGSLTTGMAEAELPMSFRASRAADPGQACRFVAQTTPGG